MNFEVEVIERSVLVNSIWVHISNSELVLLEADLKTKYAQPFCQSGESIMLTADEHSLHCGPSEEPTEIKFKMPPDWRVHSFNTGRYSVNVLLMRNVNETGELIWESDRYKRGG